MEAPTLIGLAGRAGSGKSTLARALIAAASGNGLPRYREGSMAGPLKELAIVLFNLDREDCYGASSFRNRVVVGSLFQDYWEGVRARIWDNRGLLAEFYPDDPPQAVALLWEVCTQLAGDGMASGRGVTVRQVLERLGTDWGRRLNPAMWTQRFLATAAPYTIVTDVRFANEVAAIRARGGVVYWLEAGPRIGPRAANAHVSEPAVESLGPHLDGVIDTSLPDGVPQEVVTAILEGGLVNPR
jgi:hypothetical protein